MRHRPYPYAIVPKTPLRVGCGCILYCMETRCIGCMLQLYILHASSRLARHAIQPVQRIQRIQLYTLYSIQHYTASLSTRSDSPLVQRPESGRPPNRGPKSLAQPVRPAANPAGACDRKLRNRRKNVGPTLALLRCRLSISRAASANGSANTCKRPCSRTLRPPGGLRCKRLSGASAYPCARAQSRTELQGQSG